jgi:hypothetical protein
MNDREARIDRVIRLRDERLKKAVLVLNESRAVERKTLGEYSAALGARQQAERARRELLLVQADIRDFIEAEDWLRSCSIVEEMATHRLRQARQTLAKAEQRVKEAHMKVRQLEQLRTRLAEARQQREQRVERTLDDEIGQRAAHARRGRR